MRGGRGGEARAAATLQETGSGEGHWSLWMNICFGAVSMCAAVAAGATTL